MYNSYEDELQVLIDKVEGLTDDTWVDLVDDLEANIHPDSLRKNFNGGRYSGYNVAKYYRNKIENNIYSEDEIERLEKLKFELVKERKKIQSFNNEYHKNAREEGRFELFLEGIKEAVDNLAPIDIKTFKSTDRNKLEKTGVLVISDAHYGREVVMKGLFGEVLNEYNPKEFEMRMWNLLSKLERDINVMPIDKLSIIDCGDAVEGILRLGESLKNLKSGVIESAIQYAEFMSNWIVQCYNRLGIPIEYNMTSGNHDILRILESKANFEEETVAKFIYNHINLRIENSKLKNNVNNKEIVIKPYNDVLYNNYYGTNVLAYHGDSKNMEKDINFFEDYYGITIDILLAGHLHSGESKTVGVGFLGDKEIIRVPSICGIDTYSKKIRGNSRAGAKYMVFDTDGKDWEKTYFLN